VEKDLKKRESDMSSRDGGNIDMAAVIISHGSSDEISRI